MKKKTKLSRRLQHGFSIIEALIAGLVLSFGALALVGVQVALTRNGDVARQRSEATRLAQDQMERLRAFASVDAITGVQSYAGMVTGSDQPLVTALYNTTFDREWTISGSAGDFHRVISVNVRWTDRHPEINPATSQPVQQSVRLSSVISRANHSKVGLIMANAGGTGYGGVAQSRNLNVPYPARDIGSDRSRYQWPGTTPWLVFDNNTGLVRYRCTSSSPPTDGSDAALQADTNCTQILAYVLAGYLGSNAVNNSTGIDAVLTGWTIDGCQLGNTINVDASTCFIRNVVVPRPDPDINPATGNPYNPTRSAQVINSACPYLDSSGSLNQSQIDNFKFFKCYAALIEVPLNNTSGWTGRMSFLTLPSTLPSGRQRICRYAHLQVSNQGLYDGIQESLNNENYFAFIAANGNGPNTVCPSGTSQHQPQP